MPLPEHAPPPIGPRSLAIAVAVQGRDAGAAGAPVNACPYGEGRPYSRRAWVAGHTAGRIAAGLELPDPTDHDEAAPWPGDVEPDTP